MTDRERWIVYPLLFMALGFGLRNGIEIQAEHQDARVLQTESIRCRELRVVDESGKTVTHLGVSSTNGEGIIECGEIHVFNEHGKAIAQIKANPDSGAGTFQAANGNGTWQAVLSANPTSGVLTLLDHTGKGFIQIAPPPERAAQPAEKSGESEKKE
jgi:hypothetical protein